MKKTFDCVEMKRKVQEQIYEEIRDLSREDEIAYFHRASEEFWQEINTLRKETKSKSPKE